MNGSIYVIRNTVNEKVYVGQTRQGINIRFSNHLSAARHGLDYVIGQAIRKHGEDKFYIELLEECDLSEINERETYWIKKLDAANYKHGYNISPGGGITRAIRKFDHEEIISLFNSGMTESDIAKYKKTHPYKIAEILKEHNIKYGLDLQRTDKEIEDKAIDLYLAGLGSFKIGKMLDINKSTVLRILKRHNIDRRTFSETIDSRRKFLTQEIVPHESKSVDEKSA